MTSTDRTALLLREPVETYFANAKDYLSSHQLADFRKCPLLYRKKQLGLIEGDDRPAYLVGRAAHTLILEGRDRFEEEFAVGGPINAKSGQPFGSNTKAWVEWAEAQGKPVVTDAQFELVARMNESVRTHPLAMQILDSGVPEGVVRATYCDEPCQIRMDWLDTHFGIVDLKTCDDLTWFEADARRFGYAHQVAFYRSVLAQVVGVPMPVHLIAVEKKEPFRCGVWLVSTDALNVAQREDEIAIDRLKACRADDHWPTGYEECRLFDFV